MADAGVNAATADVVAPSTADGVVELTAADLVGHGAVFCPNPRMPLWSHHPRIFIEVATSGQGRCPYCGTTYRLAGGARAGH